MVVTPRLALQAADLAAHGEAEAGVEIRQRLVEKEELRLLDQGAGERDALLLAARHFATAAGRGDRSTWTRAAHASARRVASSLRDLLEAQGKEDVVPRRHVGIERVGLEDDADVAVARLDLVDDRAVEADLAVARRIDAGEHEQRRRLAAARRPEDRDELAVVDAKVGRLDGDDVAPALGDAVELDHRHALSP